MTHMLDRDLYGAFCKPSGLRDRAVNETEPPDVALQQ